MLPDGGKTNCKIVDSRTDYCLFTGDHRVNVFVGLGILHTIFHRLHNHMVDQLTAVNPQWNAEKLYQESRKINAALHQHLTYNEYLPAILDHSHLDKYRLRVGDYKYDPTLNPNMANSFSTAAYRFGHSQVQDFVQVGRDLIPTESTLMRPHLVLTRFDEVTKGLIIQPSEMVDRFFSESMTDRLFENNGTKRDGLDLVSLNIQRGRDHGLPPYNAFRKFCGLPPVTSFRSPVLSPKNRLEAVYDHVDDIDLFIGGVVERPVSGSQVGPTFACLIAQQFHDIKFGDRFFYETEHPREGFTAAQLGEIKAIKLSNVMCITTGLDKIQPFTMFLPDNGKNQKQSCKKMGFINFDHWRENP
ncbi:chorion peroxidase [Plakobranchus ocellatus]|uniref:Chorion peroxidase n=1 Tax=Plakobranchus ocellatus TaxID=259542 RepID=A0AAV3YJR0_9GAST|nr:chorion peroxidase [Plakobranchus ocellatus]